MSIEKIKSAFESIQHSDEWSQLLRITTSKRNGTKYASRQITIEPENALGEFVRNLANHYLDAPKGGLSSYNRMKRKHCP